MPLPGDGKPRKRRRRRGGGLMLLMLAIVLPVCVGAWLATRAVYFIGVDPAAGQAVTIYRGLPYELPFGVDLYEQWFTSGVPLSAVPEDRREKLLDHQLRSRDDAEDLVHEVYLRIRNIPDDRLIGNPEGYLFSIAHSVRCRYLKREGRSVAVDIEDPLVEPLVAEPPQADEDIDAGWRIELLRKVLPQLSARCRAVMEMKYGDGASREQIAAQLGITIDGVKKHLSKGLAECRRRMQRLE